MSKYKLSSLDHELVFKILKIDIFSKGISVNSPTAIIVGGQPGAGKTNLILIYANILITIVLLLLMVMIIVNIILIFMKLHIMMIKK
jgi:ATP-dependent 26S proteasome regulatory subunit